MLTNDIAERIVRETMRRLNRNINIMDEEGRILASGLRERIGERHAGAVEAIRTGMTVVIGPDEDRRWEGARPGVNMPIVLHGRTVGAIGITGSPEEVGEFAELVRMTTELMLQQSYLASLEEWRARLRTSFMEEVEKPQPDPSAMRAGLELLRIAPVAPMRVCLVQWDEAAAADPPAFARALEGVWEPHWAVVAPAPSRRALCIATFGCGEAAWSARLERTMRAAASAKLAVRIGASGETGRLEDLDVLLDEAAFALTRAVRDGEIVSSAGLEPRLLIARASERVKARFAERTASRLSASLRETLQTFFDCNGNVQAASEAMFVHKNTVGYRLKKIKEATGLDPQRFADAVALQIALWSLEGEE